MAQPRPVAAGTFLQEGILESSMTMSTSINATAIVERLVAPATLPFQFGITLLIEALGVGGWILAGQKIKNLQRVILLINRRLFRSTSLYLYLVYMVLNNMLVQRRNYLVTKLVYLL